MDLPTLKLFLETLGAGLILFKTSGELSKITSDLGLNGLTRKRHMAEMIGLLTNRPETGKPDPHPMAIQAQFHSAFGGELWLIPSGEDLLHFLANPALATLKTSRDLAASLPLVTYSKLADGFTPAEHWNAKKLDREFTCQSIAYWFAAPVTLFCFANWDLAPSLPWFTGLGAIYAFSKAYRAGQINRARRLLHLTSKPDHKPWKLRVREFFRISRRNAPPPAAEFVP